MKIKSINIINGKNKWSESKDKLIHMVLDLGEFEEKPSNKIEGFYERIKEYLPSLKSHRCSEGKPGGFFKRIKEGTWMGHIIEHVALELQTLAGMDTGWGRTRGVKGQKGVYNVVFNYEDKDKGKLAAREAFNVVTDIINDRDPKIDNVVKKLKPKNLQESIRRILKEETITKTFQDIINKTLDEIKNICEVADADTFPGWLSFDGCDVSDSIDKISIVNVEKINGSSNAPRFKLYVNLTLSITPNWIDYNDFMYDIANRIFNKWKIRFIFIIEEKTYNNKREMWESGKHKTKKTLREETNLISMIRRRVQPDDLEREFKESLDMSSNMLVNLSHNGGGIMHLERFIEVTTSILIDGIHHDIYSAMPFEYQWYDEVKESLKKYYKDRIKVRYKKLMSEI